MRRDDAPAIGESPPELALPTDADTAFNGAAELDVHGAAVAAEGDDLVPDYFPSQPYIWAAFAEGLDLGVAVKILGRAVADRMGEFQNCSCNTETSLPTSAVS